MKRKLTAVVLCIVAVLIAIVLFSTGNDGRRNSGTGQTLIVTQDGKLTVIPQHRDGWMAVIGSTSNVPTNTPPRR